MRVQRQREAFAFRFAAEDPQLSHYLGQAHRNLMATSRTAKGVVDTSASPDKAKEMSGVTGQGAADLATKNFHDAIRQGYAQRGRQFHSPDDVRQFTEGLASTVNKGILAPDAPLIRRADSPKYPYTRTADLPAAMDHFYSGLHKRLSDPGVDPVEAAAYAEYGIDPGHHLFADGCGKTSKALSSAILMRHGLPLPTYPGGRDEYYKHVSRTEPVGPRSFEGDKSYQDFLKYYRSMVPTGGQQQTAVRHPKQVPSAPDEDDEEYGPEKFDNFGDYFHHHLQDLVRDLDIGLYD